MKYFRCGKEEKYDDNEKLNQIEIKVEEKRSFN